MGNEISKLYVNIGAKTDDFQRGVGGITKTLGGVGIGIAAVATAAIGMGTAAVASAASFESSMREVNTMLGLSQSEFETLSAQVNDLSKEVGVSGGDLASALYQVVSAGVPAAKALDVLKTSAMAAVGGVTSTETAVDGITTVLNAFKIDASEAEAVADIMFTTVKGGKTTFEELSASLYNVAPLAATAGVKFEEVSAAIATVTKQGVPTATATTQLRAAVQALIKPTAEMSATMQALGYASGDAMIKELGFAGTLNALVGAAGGSQEAIAAMFGSVEGLSAVLSLTGANTETFAADLESMTASAGASTAAYEEINEGTARSFEKLKVEIQALLVELGSGLLPLIKPIIAAMSDLIAALPIDEFSQLLKDLLPPLAEALVKLLGALNPLIEATMTFAVGALSPVLELLPDLLDAFIPIFDILAAIIDIIPIKPFMELVMRVLKPLLIPALQLVASVLKALEPLLRVVFSVVEGIMKVLGPVLEGFAKIVGWVAEGFGWIFEKIGGFFANLFGEGGIVTRPTLAIIGEEGPEAVVPLKETGNVSLALSSGMSGGGGIYIENINVEGSVISDYDLGQKVREQLLGIQDRVGTTGLA